MKTLAVNRGLEILTGKLYIFITKMTGEQGVSLVPSRCFNILLFYDGRDCLLPGVLRSQRGCAGLGRGLFGLWPRGPQP